MKTVELNHPVDKLLLQIGNISILLGMVFQKLAIFIIKYSIITPETSKQLLRGTTLGPKISSLSPTSR